MSSTSMPLHAAAQAGLNDAHRHRTRVVSTVAGAYPLAGLMTASALFWAVVAKLVF